MADSTIEVQWPIIKEGISTKFQELFIKEFTRSFPRDKYKPHTKEILKQLDHYKPEASIKDLDLRAATTLCVAILYEINTRYVVLDAYINNGTLWCLVNCNILGLRHLQKIIQIKRAYDEKLDTSFGFISPVYGAIKETGICGAWFC